MFSLTFFPSRCSGLNSLNSCLSNGNILNSNSSHNNNNNHTTNNNNNNILNNNNNLNSSTETICTSGEQPDPDFIKMFVGQVPKSMDEDQLREMFEEFGRVHSINVLRDKVNGVSKGKSKSTFFFLFFFFLNSNELNNMSNQKFYLAAMVLNQGLIRFIHDNLELKTFSGFNFLCAENPGAS